jgi:hypothetical protein
MIESSHRRGDSWTSFGERRGISDPARFGLDLERTRADTGGAAGRWCYPSPPMSGSPSIPPKSSQQAAERSQQTHPTTTQDVYSGIPATTHLADDRRPSTGPVGPRSYLDAPERSSYGFPPRLEPPAPRSLPYPQPLSHLSTQQPPPPYLPGPGIASPVAAISSTWARAAAGCFNETSKKNQGSRGICLCAVQKSPSSVRLFLFPWPLGLIPRSLKR